MPYSKGLPPIIGGAATSRSCDPPGYSSAIFQVTAADKLKNIRVVLCETAHPGNIGAAARALKTMGLAQLYLVNPARFPDPQAEWLASGATDVLRHAKICASLDETLAVAALSVACTARTRELAASIVTAREAAARVIEVARTQTAALVSATSCARRRLPDRSAVPAPACSRRTKRSRASTRISRRP